MNQATFIYGVYRVFDKLHWFGGKHERSRANGAERSIPNQSKWE